MAHALSVLHVDVAVQSLVTVISTAQFSLQQVNKRRRDLAARVNKAREKPDQQAVHDLRVSIRRFQPVLDVFEPCFPAKRVKKIRECLKGVLALAGEVRDCDSALKILSKHRTRGIASLRAKLHEKRAEAARNLQRGLEDPWDTELAVVHAQRKICRLSAHTTGRRELDRLAADFFESGNQAAASSRTSARQLHQLRIAAKKFHYTLELFAPLLGRPERVMLSKVREIQGALGAVNNQRATRDVIAGLGGDSSLEKHLKKKQRKRMKRFRRLWKEKIGGSVA